MPRANASYSSPKRTPLRRLRHHRPPWQCTLARAHHRRPKSRQHRDWSFVNTTADVHPLHVHLVQFQVLNRQTFDVPTYQQTGKLVFTGGPSRPRATNVPRTKTPSSPTPAWSPASFPASICPREKGLTRRRAPLRLALSHSRARRQRNDAPLQSHRVTQKVQQKLRSQI